MIDERSYREILKEARGKYPGSTFLQKCEEFYQVNRYLSNKQIEKLDGLPNTRKLANLYKPQTEEEMIQDLLDSGALTQEEIDAGFADDIIDEVLNEDFETWENESKSF